MKRGLSFKPAALDNKVPFDVGSFWARNIRYLTLSDDVWRFLSSQFEAQVFSHSTAGPSKMTSPPIPANETSQPCSSPTPRSLQGLSLPYFWSTVKNQLLLFSLSLSLRCLFTSEKNWLGQQSSRGSGVSVKWHAAANAHRREKNVLYYRISMMSVLSCVSCGCSDFFF